MHANLLSCLPRSIIRDMIWSNDAIEAHSWAELIHEFWWANSSLTQTESERRTFRLESLCQLLTGKQLTDKQLTKALEPKRPRSPPVCDKLLFAHQNSWMKWYGAHTTWLRTYVHKHTQHSSIDTASQKLIGNWENQKLWDQCWMSQDYQMFRPKLGPSSMVL